MLGADLFRTETSYVHSVCELNNPVIFRFLIDSLVIELLRGPRCKVADIYRKNRLTYEVHIWHYNTLIICRSVD